MRYNSLDNELWPRRVADAGGGGSVIGEVSDRESLTMLDNGDDEPDADEVPNKRGLAENSE